MREIVSRGSFRGDGSNPIATVDEIQRRLQRPIPSPSSSRLPTSTDLQPHDSIEKEKERESERKEEKKKERRLDDYLDSKLLSVISSKVNGYRWESDRKQRRIAEFEWPTEELRALSEDGGREWPDGAFNFGNDLETAVKDDGVGGGKGSGSPFRRFEETVLTLYHSQ